MVTVTENPSTAVDRVLSQTPAADVEWIDRMVNRMFAPDGDLLIELRRIADALESFTGKKSCDGVKNSKPCVLDPDHVGHHVSADGRIHWLDDE